MFIGEHACQRAGGRGGDVCVWGSAQQDQGGSVISPAPGHTLRWPWGTWLTQGSPPKAPCQALLSVPRPGPNGNGVLLLLPGTAAGAAAESILGGGPNPSITH